MNNLEFEDVIKNLDYCLYLWVVIVWLGVVLLLWFRVWRVLSFGGGIFGVVLFNGGKVFCNYVV